MRFMKCLVALAVEAVAIFSLSALSTAETRGGPPAGFSI